MQKPAVGRFFDRRLCLFIVIRRFHLPAPFVKLIRQKIIEWVNLQTCDKNAGDNHEQFLAKLADLWCYVIVLFGLALSGAAFEGYETFTDILFRT